MRSLIWQVDHLVVVAQNLPHSASIRSCSCVPIVHSELEMSYPPLDNDPSSSKASNPQKRLKLTIKPLQPKPAPSFQGTDLSPARGDDSLDAQTASTSTPKLKPIKLKLSSSSSSVLEPTHVEKPRPKIKIKPPRPRVEDVSQVGEPQAMDVDVEAVQPTWARAPPLAAIAPGAMEVDTPQSASAVEERRYEPFFQPPPLPASKRAPPPPPKPKVPRPIKLKPLKEVLTKLIAQIKRLESPPYAPASPNLPP